MKQRTPLFCIKHTRTSSVRTSVQTNRPIAIGLARFVDGIWYLVFGRNDILQQFRIYGLLTAPSHLLSPNYYLPYPTDRREDA